MAKILLAPDLHCYYSNYGRIGSDGVHTRLAEWRECADAIATAAEAHRVDVAVFPGDLFNNPRPSPTQVLEVADLFRRLQSLGVQVLACAGNHDVGTSGQAGPVDLLAEMGDAAWGITGPNVYPVATSSGLVDFVVLPWVKSATVNAQAENAVEAAEEVADGVLSIARMLRAASTASTRVFVGHWTITGSISSSGHVMATRGEPDLPLASLASMGFDAILMGHIHKPQVLCEEPFAAYAGAMQRCDFGEERDPRGCWIWDSETKEHTWVELPARRFYTIDLKGDGAVQEWMDMPDLTREETQAVKDAIVRVRCRYSLDMGAVDTRLVRQKLLRGEPHHIAGIATDLIRTERTRDSAVTEATQPLEALDRYLAQRGDVPPARAEKVKETAQAMIEELRKEVSA